MPRQINRWPLSQVCIGCINGQLDLQSKQPSTYICNKGLSPDDKTGKCFAENLSRL